MQNYTDTPTQPLTPPKQAPVKAPNGKGKHTTYTPQPQYVEEEITLKELILKTQEFTREIRHRWYIVALMVLPILSFFLYKAFSTPPTYSAEVTFMVDSDEGGGGFSGMSAVLSSFGMGGTRAGSNLERILELSKSRKIIQMALLDKATVEEQYDYLGNHLIRAYELHEKWNRSDNEKMHNFLFIHDQIQDFDREEGAALKTLHGLLVGNEKNPGLMETEIADGSGIMSLKVKTTNEELSLHLTDTLYATLSQFYVDKAIERNLQTYEMVSERADSLNQELEATEYALANVKDSYRNTYLNTESVRRSRLQRKAAMLSVMYGEAAKNTEFAAFALKNQTPFVQVVDYPMAPLSPSRESLFKNILLGLVLGLFLGIAFVSGRKIIRDAMME